MAAEIKTEKTDLGGQSVLLVSVKDGSCAIGTCSAGHLSRNRDTSLLTRIFYMENEPVINLVCPNSGSVHSDKLMAFCPGFQGVELPFRETLTESLSKLNRGDSLENALHDIFGMLSDGVYIVYTNEYYPTDGNGTFFWGAYNISHEVRGTAEHNHIIGNTRAYRPCFLVPSEPLDRYLAKTKAMTDEAVKSRRIQGIAYHLSGFHSVLLKGHHGAISCLDKGIPFKCAVIEKIFEPYTEPPSTPSSVPQENPEPQPSAELADETSEQAAKPVAAPIVTKNGITGFRSAAYKVPIEIFPKDMLRLLLETRFETKPAQYRTLISKLNIVRKKSVSNAIIPHPILEKCDKMPDCEMVESAGAIDSLSDEQLNCLLAGDVEFNGEIIISPNFYTSIVTACNYLHYHDKERFIDFAVAIMSNPALSATHEYIARRLSRLEHNAKVYGFFKSAVNSGDEAYAKIIIPAEDYVRDYEAQGE